MISSGRAPPPRSSASQPRPPWGGAAGTTLGRMFSRELQGFLIPSSVRVHLGPRPGIEALKCRGSGVAGRGPHPDSAEGGRFGGVYCRLDRPRQDSCVPPGRTPPGVDSSPQPTLVAPSPHRAGSGDGLKGRLWGLVAGAGSGDELNGRLWGLWPRAFPTLKALCHHLHPAYRKLFVARENVPAGKPGSTPAEMWRKQLVCANPAKAPASRPGRLTCPYVTLQGGFRPRLRDEGRASDGLEERAPRCTKPGSAACVSPVRW